MAEEVLYPMELIRRTMRALFWITEPETVDQVIEQTDVSRAYLHLPGQYKHILRAWFRADPPGNMTQIAMDIGREEDDAQTTANSAWRYLSDLLNRDDPK